MFFPTHWLISWQGIYLAFSDYSQIIETSLDYRDTVGTPDAGLDMLESELLQDYFRIIEDAKMVGSKKK